MGNVNLDNFNSTFGDMIARANNPRKPLTEIGILMKSEMQEDIRVGGRPDRWTPSKRAQKRGGQTLRDTGTLMNGLVAEVDGMSLSAGPTAVGKNHISDPRVFELLAYGGDVQRHARSETFLRNRNESGKFKKGTVPGKGMTFGDHIAHYAGWDFTYISPDTFQTFGQILQQYLTN